jgi:hypothetical protein
MTLEAVGSLIGNGTGIGVNARSHRAYRVHGPACPSAARGRRRSRRLPAELLAFGVVELPVDAQVNAAAAVFFGGLRERLERRVTPGSSSLRA